jgi:hypothetical protein
MPGWLARVIQGIERWGLTALIMLLCLTLSGLGFGACYLLLTTGLEMLDADIVYPLTALALVWAGVWLYLLWLLLAGLRRDD